MTAVAHGPMSARSVPGRPAAAAVPGESPGLLSLFTSLPCVSETLHAITTYNIGPVTELLERAGYLPMLVAAASQRTDGAFQVESAPRRFEIATEAARPGDRLAGRDRIGGPAADLRFRWRFVPEDYVGDPNRVASSPPLAFQPGVAQRVEVFDWRLGFHGGASGFRAYGTGRTLPDAGPRVGLAFVLDVLEGFGQLAGLAGTVVACGSLGADLDVELGLVARFMDPAGGALSQPPLAPLPADAGPEPGVTYLTFLGQVDPEHPVTLRLSLTEGFLGSNVFELLRVAELDFAAAGGRLRAGAARGELAGTVSARLSFDPVTLCPMAPIQTRYGVFEFHDACGRSLGSLASDMIEGRAFRTRLEEMLLPVFRFGGFGPIAGGTGEFAGARGILTMNSVVSVQPRTLSNLYVLRLDDPDGRFRAVAGGQAR